MVGVGTSDDRTEHDGLVWLVLKVPVPEGVEFGTHLLQLSLGGTDLEASVDGVRSEPGPLRAKLPFLEQLYRINFSGV
jgi:hypothetical protein